MPPRIKKNENKIAGELRRSQSITTFGSGSLIDLPRFSGIVSGIDKWPVQKIPDAVIHERNLEKMLGKECFYQVYSSGDKLDTSFAIPAYRFPIWYYCPECHSLDKFKNIQASTNSNTSDYNSDLFCNRCSTPNKKVKLVPSRFIVACLNGHIEEFPYLWWAHRNKKDVGNYKDHKLKLEYKGATGGLGGIHIYCETCGASTTMAGCMDKEALKGRKCSGNMPWLGYDPATKGWYKDPRDCDASLRVLQRSANNVYYPVNSSALTIPPWSEKLFSIFEQRNIIFVDIFGEDDEEDILYGLRREYKKHKELYGVDERSFIKAAYMRYRDEPSEEIDDKVLRCDEYTAFCGADVEDEYFKTTSVEVPEDFKGLISKIKQVKKLREVMVLRGFRRILPVSENDAEEREKQGLSNDDFAPLSKQPLSWLPAIELFGEGIFIELDHDAVKEWEKRTLPRYEGLIKRHKHPWIGKEMFDEKRTRYILLHTLSHLLIRQLSSQCGYATASLKEKIYSTYTDKGSEMCGILIYTSATDTDGSLGGLVREGLSERINDTLKNMLDESSWCSNDPICIDSPSQGYQGLNLAACHACTLLPETSCESLNCLLDRAAIVGTPEDTELGFFGKLL